MSVPYVVSSCTVTVTFTLANTVDVITLYLNNNLFSSSLSSGSPSVMSPSFSVLSPSSNLLVVNLL